MDEDDLKVFCVPLVLLTILISTIAGAFVFADKSCRAKWADSGMPSKWSLLTDCQIQQKDGSWLPESAYRVIK